MNRTLPAVEDAGHGYDRFGMSRRHLAWALRVAWPIYRHYFRVESIGVENIPQRGPAILVANHSGTLPFDAAMLCVDVAQRAGRALRPAADHFIGGMPFIGVALQRLGVVGGSAENLAALLEGGECMLIFPEGVPGISKPLSDRYQLKLWRVGHAELALRFRVPVIPVAVIGAEEQWPVMTNSKRLGRMMGVPHVPIPFLPLPLPVKYHIHYGEPVLLEPGANPDDPAAVQRAATTIKHQVERLIARGLAGRHGVFR